MTARLSPQREAEIAARAEAATPGPWGVYEYAHGGSLAEIAADLKETGTGYTARRGIARLDAEPLDNDPAHREWTDEEDWAQVQADASFIAHAPEDVKALAAELAAVRAELSEAQLRVDEVERRYTFDTADLRRNVDHHKGGKERWRTRAEKAEATLAALHAAGVDNWEGYDEAVTS